MQKRRNTDAKNSIYLIRLLLYETNFAISVLCHNNKTDFIFAFKVSMELGMTLQDPRFTQFSSLQFSFFTLTEATYFFLLKDLLETLVLTYNSIRGSGNIYKILNLTQVLGLQISPNLSYVSD